MMHRREADWWTREHTDLFMDLLRIYLGIALFIKGIYFMQNTEVLANILNSSSIDWFVPTVIIHYTILAHLCGGAFMAMGFLTRLAAAIQIPILIGAVFFINLPGLNLITSPVELEYAMLMLFSLCLFSVRGAGHYSIDEMLFKSDRRWHEHQELERLNNQ